MTEDKRLRHPAGGGYARGGETRQRIIDAAIGVFGERGFDAATTREIAQRAEVNPPALQYYFENKEGLYRACVEHLVTESSARFDPVISHVTQSLEDGAQGDAAVELFCLLQDAIIEHLLGSGSGDRRGQHLFKHLFMAREQSGHGPGGVLETLPQKPGLRINQAGTAILARLSGGAADDPELKLRAMMLFGQALVFHFARPATLAVLGWTDIDAERVRLLKHTVREQTKAVLSARVR
ncbi:CerR family C-terminal domain-containing protein [Robbsia sp. Bb-Pol-6]|uniref:CerR family C-terminal domain-containing protein n=1 Tax=Robbsia betulipollinis TaxID=2981849 RepID=A0ABT3ZLS4_9BURK|nr:CerR family C-terminal domain-containing protein [Robbsia betulipollinis]MCY0387475.1 CerR family C-terminal domain-containing protein [Robbsia betulipollinis]